jgi:hypothetical protein
MENESLAELKQMRDRSGVLITQVDPCSPCVKKKILSCFDFFEEKKIFFLDSLAVLNLVSLFRLGCLNMAIVF